MALDIERNINSLRKQPEIGVMLGDALDLIQSAVNNTGRNTATDPMGELPPPGTVQSLTIKASGGLVHGVIEDNNPIQRGINYFIEYADNQSFFKAHVIDMGASRTLHPTPLPGNDDSGNPQAFFFRAFSQYQGGKAGKKIAFGGATPTPVSPGGTVNMTLLPSTGSGTAAGNGEQSGQGLGDVILRRPATLAAR